MSGSTSNHSHVFSLYSHLCIYVSMYQYSYPSTHAISGLAAVCRIYTPHHPVHLCYPCISVQPPPLLGDVLDWMCLRCTWRRRSSELRDALGGPDWVSSEMHLETEIGWTQRCTWRPGSSKFGDELGGHDRANLQAVIEWVWRSTWRPRSSEFGDALGGRDRESWEMHLEAMLVRTCRP